MHSVGPSTVVRLSVLVVNCREGEGIQDRGVDKATALSLSLSLSLEGVEVGWGIGLLPYLQ